MLRTTLLMVAGLAVLTAAGRAAVAAEAPPVFQLSSLPMDRSEEPSRGGLLVRELVRQAVLISAREELGLPTRDGTLRDALDADQSIVDVHVRSDSPRSVNLTLMRPGTEEPLLKESAPLPSGSGQPIYYEQAIERLEALSRAEIAEALREAGFAAVERPAVGTAAVPPAAERHLGQMDELSHFAAVRLLHEEMRREGESPELLGALVRAYANLGQLTRYHWTAWNKAYVARSLLYAQRLAARDPDSPWGLWHRAYAKASAGLHASALADLEQAKALAEKTGDGVAEAPAWVKLMEPFCRYDTGRLAELAMADQSISGLGMFWCFLTVEHCGSQSTVIEFARLGLMVDPQCLRLIDGICEEAGVRYGHRATEGGPATFSLMLPERLKAMPQLPPRIVRMVEQGTRRGGNPHARLQIVQAMVELAGEDTGEPSWAVLAEMIREITFVQTRRRAHFMVNQWGVDASEYVNAMLPLLEGHPYQRLIEAYGHKAGSEAQKNVLKELDFVDVLLVMEPGVRLTYHTKTAGLMQGETAWWEMFSNSDFVAWDSELVIGTWGRRTGPGKVESAKRLLVISPEAPVAMATLIEGDWEEVEAQAGEWERVRGDHPALSAALARKYRELGRSEDAERALNSYISRAPELWALRMLADIRLEAGDEQGWLTTLERALKEEDYGLSHARVQADIAQHFMGRRDFQRALPYAEASAESWAGWAMSTAAKCNEGLGDYQRAELWMRRLSERYDSSWIDWYLWCERTGKGDVRAARQQARRHARGLAETTNPSDLMSLAMFHYLTSGANDAISHVQRRLQHQPGPFNALFLMVLALEAEEPAIAAEAIATLFEKHEAGQIVRPNRALHQLAQAIQPMLDGEADAVALKQVISEAGESNLDAHYLAGKFLLLRGEKEAAREHFILVVTDERPWRWVATTRTLVAIELRKMGMEPNDLAQPDPPLQIGLN
jgi:tetratricopeptide (TPR) repeat protein